LAAAQGDASAQYNLGLMYDQGRGVTQNYPESARWYRLAAAQGDASAQYNLGLMYDQGRGVPQDYKESARWYHLAAAQGHARAQVNLGVAYTIGQGVAQDYIQAFMWFSLAGASGDADVSANGIEKEDAVAALMAPQQIAKAQRLAREWKPEAGMPVLPALEVRAASPSDPLV